MRTKDLAAQGRIEKRAKSEEMRVKIAKLVSTGPDRISRDTVARIRVEEKVTAGFRSVQLHPCEIQVW